MWGTKQHGYLSPIQHATWCNRIKNTVIDVSPESITALLAATSFAAGLNVYATVATLGLLGRFDVLPIPSNLDMLQSWPVIGVAAAMFVVEFFADKIPFFDLVWNALHTFIRVPVAAFIAWQAGSQMSPGMQAGVTAMSGTIAMVAHAGKTAVRAGVTPSPEPVSNIALSTAEDVGAVVLTWFATEYPYIAAAVVVLLLIGMVLIARFIIHSLRAGWRQLRSAFAA